MLKIKKLFTRLKSPPTIYSIQKCSNDSSDPEFFYPKSMKKYAIKTGLYLYDRKFELITWKLLNDDDSITFDTRWMITIHDSPMNYRGYFEMYDDAKEVFNNHLLRDQRRYGKIVPMVAIDYEIIEDNDDYKIP